MALKIVVTGATGLIGKHLCQALKAKGYEVVASSRNATKAAMVLGYGIECVEWDGKDAVRLQNIIEGTQVLVNMIGENIAGQKWTDQFLQRIISSRLDAGFAVSQALTLAENGPSVLIQASAVGYYGNDLEASFDETSSCGSNFLGRLCKDWEASVAKVPAHVRVVYARTGIVLAKDGGAYPKLKTPIVFFVGATLGSGKQWFSWIHLKDEIDALVFLIENQKCKGVYNLCAPQIATQKMVLKALANELRRPLFLSIPAILLKFALGEMAVQTILGSQKVIPKRLLEAGFCFKYDQLQLTFMDLVNSK